MNREKLARDFVAAETRLKQAQNDYDTFVARLRGWGSRVQLHGAPIIVEGPVLAALQQQLTERIDVARDEFDNLRRQLNGE